jgi:acyl-CoA thioester hydrolase
MKIKIPDIIEPCYSTNLQVRIYDINYGNHLSNDSLISLVHEARVRFMKNYGFTELNIGGVGILLTNLIVNYKAEAFYGDSLDIHIGIGDVSKSSVDIHYELKLANSVKEIARVVTTITFFDYSKSKVVLIPEVFMSIINNYKKVVWEGQL